MTTATTKPRPPWPLIGVRHHRVIEARFEDAVAAWMDRWVSRKIVCGARLEFPCATVGESLTGPTPRRYPVPGRAHRWAAVVEVRTGLAAWVAGASPVAQAIQPLHADGIEAELEAILVDDLWRRLGVAGDSGPALSLTTDALNNDRLADALGDFPLSVAIGPELAGGVLMRCFLSRDLVARAFAGQGRVVAPALRLESRRAGILSGTVDVQARAGTVTIEISELRGLSPGDVLVTDLRLDEGIDVSIAGLDAVFAAGALGCRDGQRAVKIEQLKKESWA